MTPDLIKSGLAVLAVLLGASACTSQTATREPGGAPPRAAVGAEVSDQSRSAQQSTKRLPATTDLGEERQAQQVFRGTGTFIRSRPTTRPTITAEDGAGVSLNFIDTDVTEVIATVLGDILGLNYIIDPNVTGSITMQTNRPLPREHLLPTLETILALSGAAIIESDGLYKIVPLAVARRAGVPVHTPPQITSLNRGFNVQIVPLQYVPAAEMGKILEPITAKENLLQHPPVHIRGRDDS